MAKNKNKKNNKNHKENSFGKKIFLPEEIKRWIGGIVFFLIAIIITLSFFNRAGVAGNFLFKSLYFLIGRVIFAIPFILLISGLLFLNTKYRNFFYPLILGLVIFILGLTGILDTINENQRMGGWLGHFGTFLFLKFFGKLVTQIIFVAVFLIGGFIFWYLWKQPLKSEKIEKTAEQEIEQAKPSLIKKIFTPHFKVKEVPGAIPEEKVSLEKPKTIDLKTKKAEPKTLILSFEPPPFDLLESDKGGASPGDTRVNAAIIKKTLQNFDIQVEMSEVNVGPTVTQYTLKPAEGIKLSRITALNNDLALALAAHPIRIEAPIPGKSLVGIEVPNKVRAKVRLRNLLENEEFQKAPSNLTIALGRDVSGNPVYADIAKMPHLLVAGSTGTGKTIFLNDLMLSLLYRNSPEILRFILIDPKRVEFPVYNDLPHLLAPVIFDANRTVSAFKWLIGEMERRFDVLALAKSRDIHSFNEKMIEKGEILPYIVVVVDELADLMAAKGKEVEAGIVRLAQMARAVGIHLVLATQRPSVEVITGLIKANITSRVTFQVASQIDSRTVLDMAGAEKLLGMGDMLYLSAEMGKPRRIQAAYVSEKEVKKVVDYIKTNTKEKKLTSESEVFHNHLAEELEKSLEIPEGDLEIYSEQEDPLYEEAKKIVIQARKASASLLQRRLRLGYARAARLIDMLEQRGVVGPADGAKPREVLIGSDQEKDDWQDQENDWKKI